MNIKIPGRLEAADTSGIVAGAASIFDDTLGKKQDEINQLVVSFDTSTLKGTTKVVTVSADMEAVESPSKNSQIDVIYINQGSTSHNVTVDGSRYRTPDGSSFTITVPVNGYAELNFLNIENVVYVKGG